MGAFLKDSAEADKKKEMWVNCFTFYRINVAVPFLNITFPV